MVTRGMRWCPLQGYDGIQWEYSGNTCNQQYDMGICSQNIQHLVSIIVYPSIFGIWSAKTGYLIVGTAGKYWGFKLEQLWLPWFDGGWYRDCLWALYQQWCCRTNHLLAIYWENGIHHMTNSMINGFVQKWGIPHFMDLTQNGKLMY